MSAKVFGSAAIVGIALFEAGSALAAPPRPMTDPATSIYNWSGFYIGVEAGVINQHLNYSGGLIGSVSPSSFTGGGFIGYNRQLSNNFLIGVEGHFDYSEPHAEFASLQSRTSWTFAGGVRAGYVFNNTVMPYVGFGGTVTDISQRFPGQFADNTATGWMLNAGVEFRLGGNPAFNSSPLFNALQRGTVRAEYRRSSYGKVDAFGDLQTKVVSNAFLVGFSTKIDKYMARA